MTFFRYNSVRRVLGATLLFVGLSLALSPQVRAQAPSEEQTEGFDAPVVEPPRLIRRNSIPVEPDTYLQTIVSTAMGTSTGIATGWTSGVIICFLVTEGGSIGVNGEIDCISNSGVVASTVLGGIAGGYFGYQNNGFVLTSGGALLGGAVGVYAMIIVAPDGMSLTPAALLSGTAGGYLGYRLWRVRNGTRSSLLPYWGQERVGAMLSGRF
jgi:hypothetical protein